MKKTENKSLSLTDSALARINNVMSTNEDLGTRFRVYVTGGGCSGFQYGFKFDSDVAFDDDVIEFDNFSVLPGSETKLLKGLQLGCSGIITATCNATSALARKVYDDFNKTRKSQMATPFSYIEALRNTKELSVFNDFFLFKQTDNKKQESYCMEGLQRTAVCNAKEG